MKGRRETRWPFAVAAGALFAGLVVAGLFAPDFLSTPTGLGDGAVGPLESPPFGTDERGIPLHEYALQGARIVAFPAAAAGLLVMVFATIAGLVRCSNMPWVDTAIQAIGEVVGALPRMVVVLVVALLLGYDHKGLLPIGVVWALLAAPAAMDEAAASAGRLGGTRFVEALRAHGFSAFRTYVIHVVWKNLRPVIVRQGAEVMMQVVFLEIALSYLALQRGSQSFTHSDNLHSWAVLLYQGYSWVMIVFQPVYSKREFQPPAWIRDTIPSLADASSWVQAVWSSMHSTELQGPGIQSAVAGFVLVAIVAVMAQLARAAARAR